jgi:hypothetical protein
MRTIGILLLRVLVLGLFGLALPAAAESTSPKKETGGKLSPKQNPKGPLTADTVDPNIFDAENQKECDYPAPCGCDCEGAGKPGAKAKAGGKPK